MSLEPFLSVIIPYAGGSLAIPLGGLRAQGLDPDRFELILVEDGEHGAEGLLRRFALEFEVRVLVYRRDGFTGHSAGPMRNLGAGVARGSVLVFLDSDCLLSRDCLRRHLELASAGGETVICGGMRELPVIRQHLLERASYEELSRASVPDPRSLGHEPSRERPAHWEDFYSGNASVPGSLFRRVGGFDESGHRCHDMDLGYRLALAGARFVYAPDCEVLHVEHPRVAATRVEQARGWRHLAEKHPELSGFAEDR
ncbi:MAG TPA: glycosyltransferase, partial [Thermoanaerobaculia bacterium]|nr:glycosyltransferase [Thermoanaerobaculia bacterium]